jgi:D-arabinonate dehydratase
MKVTDIKLSKPWFSSARPMADATVEVPGMRSNMILEVTTDEGISGITPITDPIVQIGQEDASLIKVLVENAFKPLVIGEDPLDTEKIWDKMYWGSVRWGRRGIALTALGYIDIALWDLKGKILGQSVHKLLGAHRDSVAAYGTSVNLNADEEELVEIYSGFVNDGFKMVKMKVGLQDFNEDIDRVKLVRETIGPDVDLAIDVNSGWSLQAAKQMAEKLEPYGIYWLEEPLPPDEIDNHAKLAASTSIPIAVGETHATKWEFKELMESGGVDIVQADIVRCGGVTEWIKIAAIADAYGLPMCPHAATEIAASLVTAVPNGLWVEASRTVAPEGSPLIEPILPKNGEISPPTKPGFGIEFDMDIVAKLQAAPKPDPEDIWFATHRGWQWPPYL